MKSPLIVRVFFALVWLVNGVWCKILDGVPRHREIVARILGEEHSLVLTRMIGFGEVVMAAWILSGIRWKWSCAAQIAAVVMMNVIEFIVGAGHAVVRKIQLARRAGLHHGRRVGGFPSRETMNLCLPRANPFAVDAWFEYSCTLTFAVPHEQIAARLPSCLEPDTFDGKWGFIAVAVVRTRHLRPTGFPKFLGMISCSSVIVISCATARHPAAISADFTYCDRRRTRKAWRCWEMFSHVTVM